MKIGAASALGIASLLLAAGSVAADVGDPQVGTDERWYPGELSCSTFEALAATQADLYAQETGRRPGTDEEKALASWLWRNTHYFHGEEGVEDLWGKGFNQGTDSRGREYWTGLFAHGFGLCGTTHGQWAAEMEALLGHGRGRCVGVDGHNSFEVFLQGGPYGAGKWVLLDQDVSTVIFNRAGTELLSIREVTADWKRLTDRRFAPEKQHGWLVSGLDPGDGGVFGRYEVAEYLAGYGGVPPMVHLRRGESLRRYLRPGLANGRTFVFWGANRNTGGVPGPERSETWVNQPALMHGSKSGAGHRPGQARYGNAVYTYRPDFRSGDYREGVIAEEEKHVDFEFYTPYIIAATPPGTGTWDIYQPGCRNGLVLHGQANCGVALSTDQGKTWQDCGRFQDGLDLTDRVKGRRQYWLRLQSGARALAGSRLTIITVCQANPAVMPHLKENGSAVRFRASGRAVVSAGPNLPQAEAHLVEGRFGSPRVTLALQSPRGEQVLEVYAAAHILSSNPPDPGVKYQIEMSTDGGKSWKPLVKDWTIPRRGDEPKDFWSQSLCWGRAPVSAAAAKRVRIRFRNSGGKSYLRCEQHLVYRAAGADGTRVTFHWTDDAGPHRASRIFSHGPPPAWTIPTGKNARTDWVEMEPVKQE